MNNPLLQEFKTPYQTAPFLSIRNEHFKPAIVEAIQMAKAEIDLITAQTAEPTFENTLEALEFAGVKLDIISSIFFNLNSAETNDEIQKIAQEISPLLSDFTNDIRMNKVLFERIRQVWEQRESLTLTVEQKTLLEKKFKSFSRNGALLNEVDQNKLRAIDKSLASLKLKFGENVLAETHHFELHLTQAEDLAGLPDDSIEEALQTAKAKGKDGWTFTLDFPSYQAIMKYSEHRAIREQMAKAYGKRGFQDNAQNNENTVKEIVALRHERAQLLGYPTHAHFVLEERMAEHPEKVIDFLQDLLVKSKPFAQREFETLEKFAQTQGLDQLEAWDASFYSEKLRKQRFNLDDERLKPYFKLEQVLNGIFQISQKLFGLHFEKTETIEVYHPEVETFIVKDADGKLVAILYTDFFPRKGKRNGAWMTSFKNQWIEKGINSRPHISIVCNFTKPTSTKPSLLTFQEVTTLFHEFGHALHGMLANTTYPSLSGTNVYWDFVELPSQLMENWAYEKEALELFATHYETGVLIPMELVEKIKESSNFMEGMATVRQLSFGLMDMAFHAQVPEWNLSLKEFEKQAIASTRMYPDVPENITCTAFSHIFQGGYSSGYYSYKWAEVLDADAFAYFQETGIFNKETADKLQHFILSQGGTDKPMELYKRFRGKEPDTAALLRRAGLI
ncbi:MAG: M3 family metallopeptidase [Flavobacteriaceae bacterium]|nr:M3 family metallopeptidase [Flavobacteriaceae bacterium]